VQTLSLTCELWTSAPKLVGSVTISSQSVEINLHANFYSAYIHFYHGATMIPLSSNGQTYTTDPSQYGWTIPPSGGHTLALLGRNAPVEIGEWFILETSVCHTKPTPKPKFTRRPSSKPLIPSRKD